MNGERKVFNKGGGGGGAGPPVKNSFWLRGRRPGLAFDEDIVCEAIDIVEAIAIANRHFGAGEVEIRCWRGRDYEVRIHPDRSWSLKPMYKL